MCEFISGLIGAILGLLFCVFCIPFLLIITDNNAENKRLQEEIDSLKDNKKED